MRLIFAPFHPALSQQIHDLENEIGLKLFERNSRRVQLTEVGRAFLVGARRALAAAKQAVTQAQEAAKGQTYEYNYRSYHAAHGAARK